MNYPNGSYGNNQRSNQNYHPRFSEGNLPDECWQVGDSDIECAVWVSERKADFGAQKMDLRRRTESGDLVKTFRTTDVKHVYQGLAEHCARLSELDNLTPEEIEAFSFLAERTVDLLEETPSLEPTKKKPRRKKAARRS